METILNIFFEMKIQVDEITQDVSLIVTDFSDPDELHESKLLWENLISDFVKTYSEQA